jgi:hypothetical protein
MLKPYSLFWLQGLDPISHALFWTLVFNIGLFILVSLLTTQSVVERSQAVQFVNVFRQSSNGHRVWRGSATVGEIKRLVARFVGEDRMAVAFRQLERNLDRQLTDEMAADAPVVAFGERQLAGAIGAASARIMIASVVREELQDIDEMMEILDEPWTLTGLRCRLCVRRQISLRPASVWKMPAVTHESWRRLNARRLLITSKRLLTRATRSWWHGATWLWRRAMPV